MAMRKATNERKEICVTLWRSDVTALDSLAVKMSDLDDDELAGLGVTIAANGRRVRRDALITTAVRRLLKDFSRHIRREK